MDREAGVRPESAPAAASRPQEGAGDHKPCFWLRRRATIAMGPPCFRVAAGLAPPVQPGMALSLRTRSATVVWTARSSWLLYGRCATLRGGTGGFAPCELREQGSDSRAVQTRLRPGFPRPARFLTSFRWIAAGASYFAGPCPMRCSPASRMIR
jgi:hypothetical protein